MSCAGCRTCPKLWGQRRPKCTCSRKKIFGASLCVYLLTGKGKKPHTAGLFRLEIGTDGKINEFQNLVPSPFLPGKY